MTIEKISDRRRLEALQEALKAWPGIHTTLKEPSGEPPSLNVQNLQVPMHSEVLSVADGQFVNALGRKFGTVGEYDQVAFELVRTMRNDGA